MPALRWIALMGLAEARGLLLLNKICEVPRDCVHVSRDQHATGLCGDAKNVRISSAIWDNASSGPEIDG